MVLSRHDGFGLGGDDDESRPPFPVAKHETWCATHEGASCNCTHPDGHPSKARHEADKAFMRGPEWSEEDLVRMRTNALSDLAARHGANRPLVMFSRTVSRSEIEEQFGP
jgi:hypothetical protein